MLRNGRIGNGTNQWQSDDINGHPIFGQVTERRKIIDNSWRPAQSTIDRLMEKGISEVFIYNQVEPFLKHPKPRIKERAEGAFTAWVYKGWTEFGGKDKVTLDDEIGIKNAEDYRNRQQPQERMVDDNAVKAMLENMKLGLPRLR